jgi:hypothetical protein
MAQSAQLAKALAPNETPPLLLSPVVTLAVEPDPICCRYEDFARGTIDIAWQDPGGPSWPVSSGLILLDLRADNNSEGRTPDDDTALAHAYVTFHRIGRIKTDYNFLSILAGSRRSIKVVAAGDRS